MVLDHDLFARLCRARVLLDESSERPLSIPDVARKVAISPFHFIRLFSALFGTTPHQFRIEARLHRAKHLLTSSRRSVTEVCMEVGFSSLGSFSQLFARRIGTPPSTYRRLMVQVPATLAPDLVPGCLGLIGGLPESAFRSFREA
jgi:transcriptional regulator GlxA family with amidase domain